MDNKYINIYNNLVSLTRNKNIYKEFTKQDTFSHRLIILLFHFAFFLQIFIKKSDSKSLQSMYDYFFKQLELSIRENGYGDATINKKMKTYINEFHSIIKKIEPWESLDEINKNKMFFECLDLKLNKNAKIVNYFDNYRNYLLNNTLNSLSKGVFKHNF